MDQILVKGFCPVSLLSNAPLQDKDTAAVRAGQNTRRIDAEPSPANAIEFVDGVLLHELAITWG